MIEDCLEEGLIQEADIKYVVEASLVVPKDYFAKFIEMLYQNLPEKLAKFAVNSMIGCFKLKDKDMWEHAIPPSTNYNNMFYFFLQQDGTHIFSRQIGTETYYQGFRKFKHIREESKSEI